MAEKLRPCPFCGGEARLQKLFIYRMAMKYGLITEHKNKVVFYFEKEQNND